VREAKRVEDERVAWFRDALARWNQGERELETVFSRLDPDFELHSRMMGGVVHGADGLRAWWGEIDNQFDAWQLTVDSVEDLGSGGFLFLASVRLKGRKSGLEMDVPIGWVLDFRGEKLRRMRVFTNQDDARAAAALSD
jgi:ketosteroid isomerase-like protein